MADRVVHAPVPSFVCRTFRSWARRHSSPASGRRVVYFHGCGTQHYEPESGDKTVAVLIAMAVHPIELLHRAYGL